MMRYFGNSKKSPKRNNKEFRSSHPTNSNKYSFVQEEQAVELSQKPDGDVPSPELEHAIPSSSPAKITAPPSSIDSGFFASNKTAPAEPTNNIYKEQGPTNNELQRGQFFREKITFEFGFPGVRVMGFVVLVFILTTQLGELKICGVNWSYIFVSIILGYIHYHSVRMKRRNKHASIAVCSEPELLALIMTEMPKWYSLKDVEKMNWFNIILQQLWPYIDSGVSATIKDDLMPPLLQRIPGRSCVLNEFTLGAAAPKISSVKTSHSSRTEVHLDLEVKWASDIYASFLIGFKKFPFQLEFMSMQFSSTVRIKLCPLIPVAPFISAIQVSFLSKPHIDFSFKVAGVDAMSMSVPGVFDIANTVTNEITKALQDVLVYPTHLVIPLGDSEGMSGCEFMKPPPNGILRVTVIAGRDLPRMDYGNVPGISGLQSSDPYILFEIKGSTKKFRTETKKRTLNPDWTSGSSTFEVIIWDKDIAAAKFTVMDEDLIGSNDKIGVAILRLCQIDNKKKEFELPIRLSNKGSRDPKAKNPKLLIEANYFPCEELSVEACSKSESIGILTIGSLEISAVQSLSGKSILHEKLFINLECSNEQKQTVCKLNKPSPYCVTWMESFFFIVKNAGPQTHIRFTVMQKVSNLNAVVGKTLQAVSFGEMESKNHKRLGHIELSIADITKGNGYLEISDQPLISKEVMGHLSCVCEFKNS